MLVTLQPAAIFILQGNSLCLLYGLMKGMSRKRERGIRFISGRGGRKAALFLVVLPKPVTSIAFEGTRRTKKGISAKYAALLAGARQGGTTKSALKRPLAGNILQQAPAFARTTRQPCVARASTLPARV